VTDISHAVVLRAVTLLTTVGDGSRSPLRACE
jgi:hypothetical protein